MIQSARKYTLLSENAPVFQLRRVGGEGKKKKKKPDDVAVCVWILFCRQAEMLRRANQNNNVAELGGEETSEGGKVAWDQKATDEWALQGPAVARGPVQQDKPAPARLLMNCDTCTWDKLVNLSGCNRLSSRRNELYPTEIN